MSTHGRRRYWLAGLLLLIGLGPSLGCSPALLSMVLMPWTDDKVPPEYKLATGNKEVTVAIMTAHGRLELRPEVQSADAELAEKLTLALRKRCQENKEKVKVLPPAQVRAVQSRLGSLAGLSPVEAGQQLKADFVIYLEINALSLYEEGSRNSLHRGNAEIAVSLYDLGKPDGEHKVLDKPYRSMYPANSPKEASPGSEGYFRGLFLDRIAKDLSRAFTSSPPEERFGNMRD